MAICTIKAHHIERLKKDKGQLVEKVDIIVFGATSFVGQIVCRYLLETSTGQSAKQQNSVSWAMAGRSLQKLQSLHASLGSEAGNVPVIVADANDTASLKTLCERAKLVISTVGPYALYGEAVVKACVSSGTDYCDLTGEPQFIMKMLQRYEKIAKATGARIVHCCGFDSVPSDLGVWFTQQNAHAHFSSWCTSIAMRVHQLKGAASGGTIASMVNISKEVAKDGQLRKALSNPYALCPVQGRTHERQPAVKTAIYDRQINAWIAPFIMAAINERIVHRSNALMLHRYSKHFHYHEAMVTGEGPSGRLKAHSITVGVAGFLVAAALAPTRWLMENTFLPKPGEGPTIEQQQQGFYDLRFYGRTAEGQKLTCKVTGDQDPGYGSTAKILSQCAICLIKDIPKEHCKGGFWTPASAMAEPLIERLRHFAGLTFECVQPQDTPQLKSRDVIS